MALTNRAAKPALASSGTPSLPDRLANVLQETRWILFIAVGGYLALALFGFQVADPGWSHAAAVDTIKNPAGRFGAWIADLLIYLFGLSAWWWVMLSALLVWRGYRRLDEDGRERHTVLRLALMLGGFLVVLLASAALESLRFHSHQIALPLSAGGALGFELGKLMTRNLGFTGGTLLLLFVFAAGLSVMIGFSWLKVAEAIGVFVETSFLALREAYERWQDRRIGVVVAKEREEIVEVEKKKYEYHEPVHIEMPKQTIEVAPKAEKRIEREKQSLLFPEAVLGGLLPPLHLLDPAPAQFDTVAADTLEYTSRLIERKLGDFGVQVKVVSALPGPVITRYEFEPAVGVKGSTVMNLAKDLARALSLISVRIVETVPGKACMALELPNSKRQTVKLSEILASKAYHGMHSPLTLTLGKDISGQPVVADLAKMPHLLVAGTTGSGKSVGVNAMILSLLYKSEPEHVRLIMVDPKMLELSIYEGIPHLLAPVVTDMRQAANALSWCVAEMERRYKIMSALGVRNIAGCNAKIKEALKSGHPLSNPLSLTPEAPEPLLSMPYIVVVVDEFADMIMVVGKKVEELIARLAQKARASGIHLILATQRPSVDVITGLIKANIPTRIAFQVSSKIDSRTILDQMGAEALLGQGDMLYLAPGTGYPTRVHGAFVTDDEVHRVVEHLKQAGAPDYDPDILTGAALEGDDDGEGGSSAADGGDAENDPLYDQAVDIVVKSRRASISLVQRQLRIGYNRSSRLVEAMEKSGVVSPPDSRGSREVLAPSRAE
jgi:DNA segregation ATPase FtsK/SpoIIIE, S-DNA-T family